eukprot:403347661
MSMYEQGIFRVIIDDVRTANHKRFKSSSYMGFEYVTLKNGDFKVLEQSDERLIIEARSQDKSNIFQGDDTDNSKQEHAYKYVINYKPFKIFAYLDDNLIIAANNNQFFNFEYERNLKEHYKIFNKSPYDATYKFSFDVNDQNQFTEMFDGFVDTNNYGPRAIGMDFEFNQEHLFGLPEHAIDFRLPDTYTYQSSDQEPYRLYNVDVFPYKLNSTSALYGSVPFVMSHSHLNEDTVKGNCGIYWSNAAETWVDIYTPNTPESPIQSESSLKRGLTFNSESGILEFVILMAPTPNLLQQKWADISGHAPMAPYWSLGYHQSKWSYESAQEVVQMNFKFDQHGLPVDVFWLDIDHTSNFEYFTWNQDKFSNATLEIMNELLNQRQRKVVVISDPHIKRNESYFVYRGILELEQSTLKEDEENRQLTAASGKYLIRDPKSHDKHFVGKCWPGTSVWLDFMQSKVRQFWAALYQYDVQFKTNKNYFVWNDMNEPSVLDKAELSLPKGAMHYTDDGKMVENREVHNLYGALMHQSSFYGLLVRNESMNHRPFVLSRAFYAGSQKQKYSCQHHLCDRFGAVWTGDNGNYHEDMKMSVQMLLSMSVAGLGFVGADIGGYANQTIARVIVQWHQLGVFQPFMRQHCHKEAKRREPYLYKGEGYNQLSKSLRLRQKILPYIYTKFYEHHKYGAPLMRPMFYEFPQNNYSSIFNEQYMFGDIFLVKPDEKDYTDLPSTTMYFPEGTWYDFFTSRRHEINETGLYEVYQESGDYIYVYARGGKILPQREKIRMSAMLSREEGYLLNVYLDTKTMSAEGYLYMDDGETFNHEKSNQFKIAKFQYTNEHVLMGGLVDNGSYYNDLEVIKGVQVFGLNKDILDQITETVTVYYKNSQGDRWATGKTVQIEKIYEHEMIVILDLDVSLMKQEWKIELTNKYPKQ